MSRVYSRTGSLKPGRSFFDLSYEKIMTADMGYLYPVVCDEMVPGDVFKFSEQIVLRFQPLVAPILHPIEVTVHFFAVPYRIIDDTFEEMITGGEDGESTVVPPTWNPTNTAVGSLWDYFGFPTGITPAGALPLDYPRRAYNSVWNAFYRDENLQDEVLLTNETILNRNWTKDYFTSSLPFQQRGIAPSLPISGTTHAVFPDSIFEVSSSAAPPEYNLRTSSAYDTDKIIAYNTTQRNNLRDALNANTVDLSVASTFDIADLRLAFQIQRWMERNARAGVRYTEFLHAHFGVSPRDDRLQRPEYIGGCKAPVIISEVLQTSSTDATSAQGNLAGHGISVSSSFCGSYRAVEFGLVIAILSVMPKPVYSQGINRQWLRRTRYDFPFPEFCNLSEQAIENAEICATADSAHNTGIFGYQGRYDELRTKDSMVVGQMRSTFDYWHLARQFNTAAPPTLNSEFVTCVPRKDIFAAPSEPGLIISVGNVIKAFRPIPIMAEPGLIDH